MPYRHTDNVTRKLAGRREAILTAARDLATQAGMAAVQIAPVAERAGVAAGTVYRYFSAKTELVAALVEALTGPLAAAAAGDNPREARERVQSLTLFALRALGVVDARARGLVVQTVLPGPVATLGAVAGAQ